MGYPSRVADSLDSDPSPTDVARLLAAWPQVRLVGLFGSVARGTARSDSDVDIGVLGGGFWDQLGAGAELGRLFGREPHVVDLGTASDWLRFQVAREGRALFQREPDAWARFQAESAIRYFDVAPIIARCAQGVRERLRCEAEARARG